MYQSRSCLHFTALASVAKCFECLVLPRRELCANQFMCQSRISCDICLIYRPGAKHTAVSPRKALYFADARRFFTHRSGSLDQVCYVLLAAASCLLKHVVGT